ncbi:MAG: gliding motility-associated C-terminal domain-containing protein [Saprospiraceae bacterium]|nr:gliding motility-associated C-terminal domain-containing protein [Saprospiraceae bacterium]
MRSLILLYFALYASSILYAGDTPCAATMLSTDNQDFVLFNNNINSNSGIDAPPYGGYVGPDTWISFTMPSNGFYLIMNGTTMIDPAIAVYSGPCSEPKLLYNILDNNCDGSPNPLLFIDQLNPGETYFIRVWAQDGSPNGEFEIKIIQSISPIPDFLAFADASIVGECIQLTQNTGNQQGCAWYQNAIDFTMPFSHEMTANFGTTDANGADGICLVYQSNGQDFCGGTGEGIGASGMPNSAIFEFDTWQNGNLADPFQDHCAFNINGNMNHNNSIEGPITLGNIEDGLDHTIRFDWSPSGNQYSVYFDNILVLNGSFDIINNCFGGSTTAFWGYTSATGGSSNLQVVCPIVEAIDPSYTEYNEVDICEGESYMGHNESGFYVDFIPGPNGCDYQLNTLLHVHELPEPEYLYQVVCEGEYTLVGDEVFTLPNLYEINTFTEFGCDSTIFLQLENVVPSVEIVAPSIINCTNTSVELIPIPGSNFDINSVNFTWSTGQSYTNQEILIVEDPGTYFLTAQITSNGLTCLATSNVTIEMDTMPPIGNGPKDLFLDCTNFDADTLLMISEIGDHTIPAWSYQDSIVGNTESLSILGAGSYFILLTDTLNGCTTIDSFNVTLSNDIPNIELTSENLNCQQTSITPLFSSSGEIENITWSLNNQFFSFDSIPLITQAGNYNVEVITKDGCTSEASITIQIDTIKPTVLLRDTLVPCDIEMIELSADANQAYDFEWYGNDVYNDSSLSLSVYEEGVYFLSITDTTNYCTHLDSVWVNFKGPSPSLSIENDTINCYTPFLELIPESNESDLTYHWTDESEVIGENKTIEVDSEGWYYIDIQNSMGCSASDSAYISSNFSFPAIAISFDTINCILPAANIEAAISNGEIVYWEGPNNFQTDQHSFTTSVAGFYYINTVNQESGCSLMDTINILDTSLIPDFEIGSDTLDCISEAVLLPFTLETPYLNIQWSGPDNFTSNTLNPEVSIPGAYMVHIDFAGECSLDTTVQIVQEIDLPSYALEYDSITCTSPQSTITTTILDTYSLFSITSPDGSTTSMTNITSIDSGFYYLYLEGENGCAIQDTFYISSFLDAPEIELLHTDSLTCKTTEIDIFSETTSEHIMYQWKGPNGFSEQTQNISVSIPGTYSITAINEFGCSIEKEVQVLAYQNPPNLHIAGGDIYCNQLESIVRYESTDNEIQELWSSIHAFTDYEDSIKVTEEGWYFIQIENRYGCTEKDSFYVEAYVDAPEIYVLSGDTVIVNVDYPEVQLNVDVSSNSDFEVVWSPSIGLSCFDCLNPLIVEVGSPYYEIKVTDEYGCTSSALIHVRYKEDLKVVIPNVFSPSLGDGSNDYFTIYGNENIAQVNHMLIYDRWGNLVSQNNSFQPNVPDLGWNGYISGKLAQSAVYVYAIEITTVNGTILEYFGTVTLL